MSVLSMVYERLAFSHLCVILESEDIFPWYQYTYRRVLGTADAFFDIVCAGNTALDLGRELSVVLIAVSAAFDRLSHPGRLFKLCDVFVRVLFLML